MVQGSQVILLNNGFTPKSHQRLAIWLSVSIFVDWLVPSILTISFQNELASSGRMALNFGICFYIISELLPFFSESFNFHSSTPP